MSDEYLTKEEIRRWRSSVEKITLEDYAARLGKKIQEAKKTNDLADLVYKNYNPTENVEKYDSMAKLEKIDIAPKIIHQEKNHAKEIAETKKEVKQQSVKTTDRPLKEDKKDIKEKETKKEKVSAKKAEKIQDKPSKGENTKKTEVKSKKADSAGDKLKIKKDGIEIEFSKALTDREEKVLDYFIKRRGEIVFAKDLAELLDLKRDYIYKYIKNLRAKMTVDLIANADNGGFKLS